LNKSSFFTNAKNTLSRAAKMRPSRRGHKSRYQYDFFFFFVLLAAKVPALAVVTPVA
jgi:hypothetical protein